MAFGLERMYGYMVDILPRTYLSTAWRGSALYIQITMLRLAFAVTLVVSPKSNPRQSIHMCTYVYAYICM